MHGRDVRNSVDPRNDICVAQVQCGLFDGCLVGFDCCLRREQRLSIRIELTLGNGVGFGFGNVAFYVNVGVRQLRLRLGELSLGLIECRLKWAWVDLKQEIARFDELAVLRDNPGELDIRSPEAEFAR